MQPIDERKVLDHGVVALMDTYGDNHRPAVAARTSYRADADEYGDYENERLIRYLVNHRHTTPLEFCGATFFMVMPIFVARQLVRHRTASINEESLRYVEAREEFYLPAPERFQKQSQTNKQGSAPEVIDGALAARALMDESARASYGAYCALLETGLAKELCRLVLPLSTYTGWYWSNDLHNILHLLSLRLDPHAQYECRVYAEAMLDLLRPVFPAVISAWEEYRATT